MGTLDETKDKIEEIAQDVARDAGAVADKINSARNSGHASSGDIKNLIAEISAIEARLPVSATEASQIKAIIDGAKEQANTAIREKEAAETAAVMDAGMAIAGTAGSFAFAGATLSYMKDTERNFYDSLALDSNGNPIKMQAIAVFDSSGNVIGTQQIGAKILQADFARIKYQSLATDEQEKIRGGQAAPSSEEELTQLKGSLDRMEGYKLNELHTRGAGKEEKETHAHFEKAREQIKNIRDSRQNVERLEIADKGTLPDQINQTTAKIVLGYHQMRLEQILRQDILPTLAPDDQDPAHSRAQEFTGRLQVEHVDDMHIGKLTPTPHVSSPDIQRTPGRGGPK